MGSNEAASRQELTLRAFGLIRNRRKLGVYELVAPTPQTGISSHPCLIESRSRARALTTYLVKSKESGLYQFDLTSHFVQITMSRIQSLLSLLLAFFAIFPTSVALTSCTWEESSRRRLFLLSDIANEPDDAQSLVRLLTYANEFQIEGLVATTSWWLNDTTRPDQMREIVGAYAESVGNLRKHASAWPDPDYLLSLIKSGSTQYGMNGVGEYQNSEGSELLVAAVDKSEEPLWIPIWGGSNTLAQALWHVNTTRSAQQVDDFVTKLRVYSISDQDNSGPWIRRNWPKLFYISSVHDFNRYANAAWGGISGDDYYHFPNDANKEVISKSWIKKNIQAVGPLGAQYPDGEFIVEGEIFNLLIL